MQDEISERELMELGSDCSDSEPGGSDSEESDCSEDEQMDPDLDCDSEPRGGGGGAE
jgi:hypothetical protein